MGKPAHTPGPWRYSPSIPDRGFEAQVWDADGKALLFLAEPIGSVADANARLIAAAPELLAICERLLQAELGGYTGGLPHGLVRDAEAAVAKATSGGRE